MSTRDNSISLAVEMAYELIPGVCHSGAKEDRLWKRAAEFKEFGLKIPPPTERQPEQCSPSDLLAALLYVAAAGAAIPLEELRRLVWARSHGNSPIRIPR